METIVGMKTPGGGESSLSTSGGNSGVVDAVDLQCCSVSPNSKKSQEQDEGEGETKSTVTTTSVVVVVAAKGEEQEVIKINNNCDDGLSLVLSTTTGGDEELEGEKTPLPNFCVEGSGHGDSTVTVAAARGSSLNNTVNSCLVDSCCLSNGRSLIDGCVSGGDEEDENCDANGSAPISVQSVQSSEDMVLVSWYSEPEEIIRDCCKTNLISRQSTTETISTSKRTTARKKTTTTTDLSTHNNNLNRKIQDEKEEGGGEITQNSSSSKSSSGGDGESLDTHHHNNDKSEEKTPMRSRNKDNSSKLVNSSGSQRLRMHVQVFEQNSPAVENCNKLTSSASHHVSSGSSSSKVECPRCCARRSKSGTTTPAAPAKTPSRRVVHSSKSTQELKKPIKSILKSDFRNSASGGSRSGSGSEKQSSMDSLNGSASGIACAIMTRSDGGSRTKFNFNSESFSSSSYSPEEKNTLSKLKRIEKYATLRLAKSRVRPLDFGSENEAETCDQHCCKNNNNNSGNHATNNNSNGGSMDCQNVMSKSMSFLEKSLHHHHHHNGTSGGGGGNSSLKRQGSLRLRKQSPLWEPSGTRTSALRMQKMQEAKNKTSSSGGASSKGANFSSTFHHQSNNSNNNNHQHGGSNHSGSGESIHQQQQHHGGANSINSNTNSQTNRQTSGMMNHHHHHSKDKHGGGAKVFNKLSSASGQTASSAMKRLKQERGVQTDSPFSSSSSPFSAVTSPTADGGQGPFRISPVPTFDQGTDEAEQIKNLEILAQRYRTTALRFQHEYEKSEQKNRELLKQLAEVQSESSEMIEFLQAEKSTLAESLSEVENEGKKLKEQVDTGKKESQSRCSSLVRLSEQHKQEALKSQALLKRLESNATAVISKQSAEISDAAVAIQETRQIIVTLIEKLIKTYKVPARQLASAAHSAPLETNLDESDLSSSLLLPLVNALVNIFPSLSSTPPPSSSSASDFSSDKKTLATTEEAATNSNTSVTTTTNNITDSSSSVQNTDSATTTTAAKEVDETTITNNNNNTDNDNSLKNLNQAILDREAAEQSFHFDGTRIVTDGLESIRDGHHLSIKTEIDHLNHSIAKLVTVIRIIVIQCDKKVSGVASNILQCLRSMEEEKAGTIPDMVNVQKSLEAWNCKATSPTFKIFENGQNHT